MIQQPTDRILTREQQDLVDGSQHVTFQFLVRFCGGINEVYDALLDDILPAEWREDANLCANRQEVIARAHWRLARQLERFK